MNGTLFTKPLCSACQDIKQGFDLKALGIEVEELDNNPDALALLAWHECVELAEKSLPILVLCDGTILTNGKVKDYLETLS